MIGVSQRARPKEQSNRRIVENMKLPHRMGSRWRAVYEFRMIEKA